MFCFSEAGLEWSVLAPDYLREPIEIEAAFVMGAITLTVFFGKLLACYRYRLASFH